MHTWILAIFESPRLCSAAVSPHTSVQVVKYCWCVLLPWHCKHLLYHYRLWLGSPQEEERAPTVLICKHRTMRISTATRTRSRARHHPWYAVRSSLEICKCAAESSNWHWYRQSRIRGQRSGAAKCASRLSTCQEEPYLTMKFGRQGSLSHSDRSAASSLFPCRLMYAQHNLSKQFREHKMIH